MVVRVACLLVAQAVAEAAEGSAGSLEGVSLLQTQAHVHVHGYANETSGTSEADVMAAADLAQADRDGCENADGSSNCWPGYKFGDFVPPGCLSQGVDPAEFPGDKKWFGSSWVVGKCDRLVTPTRVAAFNKALQKFGGCATGYPDAKTWQQPIKYNMKKIGPASSDEERAANVAECVQLAETDKRCAGANVVSVFGSSCYCWGGTVLLDRRDDVLTCGLKSLPAEQNPKQYDCNTRKECIYNIKETKEPSSCSKGWWVMAGGWPNPKPSGIPFGIESGGHLQDIPNNPHLPNGGRPWNFQANNAAYRQPPGIYAGGAGKISTRLDGNGKPSDCAKAVKQCIDNGADYCKDPITGEPPKGASMVAAAGMSQTDCKAWFGDISQGIGAVIGQKAPDGALYNQQATWICLVDDEDPESGDVIMEGAKKSGRYKPDGPKKPDHDEGTPDQEPLTKEEKAMCKTDKKTLREAQKLKREYKKAFKDAREAARASRAKFIEQRNVVKELKAKLGKCG